MSWLPDADPECPAAPSGVELVIVPRAHDVGGLEVRRALPAKERQMVGPFIFFDQMGPGEFLAGKGLDVRPHPHIGLATVTYLFDGSILHRDSLGSEQPIVPGDVNWMTAGRGIAHSERTDPGVAYAQQPPVRHSVLGRAPQSDGGDRGGFRAPPGHELARHRGCGNTAALDRWRRLGCSLTGLHALAAVLRGCRSGPGRGTPAAGAA